MGLAERGTLRIAVHRSARSAQASRSGGPGTKIRRIVHRPDPTAVADGDHPARRAAVLWPPRLDRQHQPRLAVDHRLVALDRAVADPTVVGRYRLKIVEMPHRGCLSGPGRLSRATAGLAEAWPSDRCAPPRARIARKANRHACVSCLSLP